MKLNAQGLMAYRFVFIYGLSLALDFTAQYIPWSFLFHFSVQRPTYFQHIVLHIFTAYFIPPNFKTTLHLDLHLNGHEWTRHSEG